VKIAFVLLVLAACGGSRSEPPTAPTPPTAGDVGAVCSCGRQSEGKCTAVDCKAGLVCSYPCGIDGCDSVCMTAEDAENSRNIP